MDLKIPIKGGYLLPLDLKGGKSFRKAFSFAETTKDQRLVKINYYQLYQGLPETHGLISLMSMSHQSFCEGDWTLSLFFVDAHQEVDHLIDRNQALALVAQTWVQVRTPSIVTLLG